MQCLRQCSTGRSLVGRQRWVVLGGGLAHPSPQADTPLICDSLVATQFDIRDDLARGVIAADERQSGVCREQGVTGSKCAVAAGVISVSVAMSHRPGLLKHGDTDGAADVTRGELTAPLV